MELRFQPSSGSREEAFFTSHKDCFRSAFAGFCNLYVRHIVVGRQRRLHDVDVKSRNSRTTYFFRGNRALAAITLGRVCVLDCV